MRNDNSGGGGALVSQIHNSFGHHLLHHHHSSVPAISRFEPHRSSSPPSSSASAPHYPLFQRASVDHMSGHALHQEYEFRPESYSAGGHPGTGHTDNNATTSYESNQPYDNPFAFAPPPLNEPAPRVSHAYSPPGSAGGGAEYHQAVADHWPNSRTPTPSSAQSRYNATSSTSSFSSTDAEGFGARAGLVIHTEGLSTPNFARDFEYDLRPGTGDSTSTYVRSPSSDGHPSPNRLRDLDAGLPAHTSTSDSVRQRNQSTTEFSFVPIGEISTTKKRPRRRYDEIQRLYACSYPECTKAYGTLNHLNAHVSMQKHGSKRSPSEFKELRKVWRKQRQEGASPTVSIGGPGSGTISPSGSRPSSSSSYAARPSTSGSTTSLDQFVPSSSPPGSAGGLRVSGRNPFQLHRVDPVVPSSYGGLFPETGRNDTRRGGSGEDLVGLARYGGSAGYGGIPSPSIGASVDFSSGHSNQPVGYSLSSTHQYPPVLHPVSRFDSSPVNHRVHGRHPYGLSEQEAIIRLRRRGSMPSSLYINPEPSMQSHPSNVLGGGGFLDSVQNKQQFFERQPLGTNRTVSQGSGTHLGQLGAASTYWHNDPEHPSRQDQQQQQQQQQQQSPLDNDQGLAYLRHVSHRDPLSLGERNSPPTQPSYPSSSSIHDLSTALTRPRPHTSQDVGSGGNNVGAGRYLPPPPIVTGPLPSNSTLLMPLNHPLRPRTGGAGDSSDVNSNSGDHLGASHKF